MTSSALLICSGGGHLKQLFALAARLGIAPDDQTWATFDNPLSRTLLAGREVFTLPYAAPRDAFSILRTLGRAHHVLASRRFDLAVSTGSSPAVSFLPWAARRGARALYIESAARADGPSVSGRILMHDPRVTTFTQYPGWADEAWSYHGSIFDSFAPAPPRASRPVRRAVVTLGTQEQYGFARLLRAVVPLLAGCEVLWQLGPTGAREAAALGVPDARAGVPHDELSQAIGEADVVIAHAGTGSALTAFEQGHCPVLVPRLARHGEHVDDHQLQIARELERRGLAVAKAPRSSRSRTWRRPRRVPRAASRLRRSISTPPSPRGERVPSPSGRPDHPTVRGFLLPHRRARHLGAHRLPVDRCLRRRPVA
ncbi:glycosyltransferase family 28 [Xylanimonas allomyrinae]|uniref:Glycosyltransferase family 28 n=1 Tax=Xylanimonas allomyrinae TaxID=2509459 RepID=A0A4P6EU67_9MICO|nr:glycosyltransferase [Xylanimonas allomyrinae]QAY63967.1 glycosyltransferase family 28 [Xylanimonas allomyrinae]